MTESITEYLFMKNKRKTKSTTAHINRNRRTRITLIDKAIQSQVKMFNVLIYLFILRELYHSNGMWLEY